MIYVSRSLKKSISLIKTWSSLLEGRDFLKEILDGKISSHPGLTDCKIPVQVATIMD